MTQLNLEDQRSFTRRQDDILDSSLPMWAKTLGLVFGPSLAAAYLMHAIVGGVVPTQLEMQKTMTQVVAVLGNITAEHMAAKAQNERIISVLSASCANAAKTNEERERCLR